MARKQKREVGPSEEGGGRIRDIWPRARIRYDGTMWDGFYEPESKKPAYEVKVQKSLPGSWPVGFYRVCCLPEAGFRPINEAEIWIDKTTTLADERRRRAQAEAQVKPKPLPPPPVALGKAKPLPPPPPAKGKSLPPPPR